MFERVGELGERVDGMGRQAEGERNGDARKLLSIMCESTVQRDLSLNHL